MSYPTSSSRYAIYFAPAESSLLDRLGSHWLGRDARTGETMTTELPASISLETWQAATDSPRRYGFHATLKPPFKLVKGMRAEDLKDALAKLAETQQAFSLPRLSLGTLGRFLALVLSTPSPALHDLAASCVRELDAFREPPDAVEIAKRMHPSLTKNEQQNLIAWGYPYVLDTWKFHMSLTSSLKPEDLELFREHLARRFSEVCEQPLLCDSICLFEEPAPNHPLLLIERYPLSK
jgi:putative phosphonate metabolism protein